jgi:hypothetical protein
MREKRRPTLEELKEMPVDLWKLELAQIDVDAEAAGRKDVREEVWQVLLMGPVDDTPDQIVALWEKLHSVQLVEASVAV